MMLNFTIPKELYSHIGDYDVAKPKLVRQSTKPPVNQFPKAGIPENLIPETFIPKNILLENISYVNAMSRGVSSFYDNLSHSFCHHGVHFSITLTAGRYWFASWFDVEDKENVFHYSVAFRNLKSYKNLRQGRIWGYCEITEDQFTTVTHNRKEYLYYHQTVTKELLNDRKLNLSAVKFSSNLNNVFRNHLKKFTLVWYKSSGIFEAHQTSMAMILPGTKTRDFSWKPDFSYIVSKIKNHNNSEFIQKLNTPFFKKKLNSICHNFIQKYYSASFDRWKDFLIYEFLYHLDWIDSMYNYQVPVDYFQNIWSELNFDDPEVQREFRYCTYQNLPENVQKWFQENVPMKSFVNMFIKDRRQIEDIVSMMQDILRKRPDFGLKYSGRWRVQDFHDWVMGENWKLSNKNEKLPQDLFPKPVKVEKMTFIQPINTHQLASWGRAARNCVGSSSYSNGVLKKNHFIILALKGSEPYLTIQARLENKQLKVIQIKKNCNAELTPVEKNEYCNLFKKALIIRSMEISND